jgi:uncharacterized protein YdhG (YjbR/CyaY superfamily)
VEQGACFGTPALYVRRRFLARLKEDGESVAIRLDFSDRDVLLEAYPQAFYLTDHYRPYPAVLMRLGQVRPAVAVALLEQAWRRAAPKRLLLAHPPSRAAGPDERSEPMRGGGGVERLTGKPRTIDDYLARLDRDKRTALEKIRKSVKAAAPRAEECISYQLAAFRLDGKILVAFGASANHCAFYPMSSSTVKAHQDELEGYVTSKGTIRFPADKPLPAALVRKLVRARIAENAG